MGETEECVSTDTAARTSKPAKRLRPTLTLEGKGDRINVGVDTIRVLNAPPYVCLLRGIEDKTIAIAPCEEKHLMSFKVPEDLMAKKGKKFRINSKTFVHEYIESMGLDHETPYVMKGVLDESKNIVVFRLEDGPEKIE